MIKTNLMHKANSKTTYVILGIIVLIFILGHIAEFAGVMYKEVFLK